MKKTFIQILILLALISPFGANAAISVLTHGATDITDTAATLRGTSGGGATAAYFRYSAQTKPPIFCKEVYGTNMKYTPDLPSGSASYRVFGLRPGTTYYYCMIASNKDEISYGIGSLSGYTQSFKTLPCQACPQTEVETLPAIVISPSSAMLRGEFGSTKEVTAYFEYKKTEGGNWIEVGKDDDDNPHPPNTYRKFSFLLKELEDDTEYTYRAVAEETDGETYYGDEIGFKTFTLDQFGDFGGWIYQDANNQLECAQNPDSPGCGDNNNNSGGCPPGTQGTPPNCTTLPPLPCSNGWTGTPPNCIPPSGCPAGTTGTFPDCVPIDPEECPDGWTGTPPNCEPTECPDGWTGTPPDNCNPPPPNNPNTNITFTGVGSSGGSSGTGSGSGGSTSGGSGTTGGSSGGSTGTSGGSTGSSSGNSGGNSSGTSSGNSSSSDSDGDGTPNTIDTDDDNDGILDSFDGTPQGPGSNGTDLDGDGIPNSIDNDDDNDGTPDSIDKTPFGTGSDPNDLDGDGINNLVDDDTDGDGIPNSTDSDDDNDGAVDGVDSSPRGGGSGAGTGLDKETKAEVKGATISTRGNLEQEEISFVEEQEDVSFFGKIFRSIFNFAR